MICGECKYHKYSPSDGEWICTNEDSDNYALETEYCDSCVDGGEK